MKLFSIRGGVHPDPRKQATEGLAVTALPIPGQLFIPLQQHIGLAASPIVRVGERVLKGQRLADSQGHISAPVHAPASGKIKKIGNFPALHPSGLNVRTILLEPDGKEDAVDPSACDDPFALEPREVARRVAEAGVVGMGGATFPSGVKLNLGSRFELQRLVINGAECEPYLTCDDRLMQEHADEVVDGIRIMMHALGVKEALVAIEENKPQAIQRMREAAKIDGRVRVVAVPTRYPMGSEKHLVQTLIGRETPARALTADIGVVVHNPATARAVGHAVRLGKPLTERIVTVTGGAITTPSNLLTPIGVSIATLVDHCGGFREEPARLLNGGPMMGQSIPSLKAPVVKGSNGVLALSAAEVQGSSVSPCIRCASCVDACPCGLLPLDMALRARKGDLDGATRAGLLDCISCGSCAYVCPAHIPLVQWFSYARGELTTRQRAKHKQEETKRLAAARTERMERQQREKKEMLARRKAEAEAKKRAEAEASQEEEA